MTDFPKSNLIFQQLFDSESCTYTYIIADPNSKEAAIIDPVLGMAPRDLKLIEEMSLKLKVILETHIHADHVTGAGLLADKLGAKIALSEKANAKGADILLKDHDQIEIGNLKIKILETPGHTKTCLCYLLEDRVFTGDTLTIRGNGRTDFQQGSSEQLFHSIHQKLYTLPEETLVFPGHDYNGMMSSTIGLEKKFNKRIDQNRSLPEFIQIMKDLKLALPQKIDIAVPANLNCGRD